MIKASAVQCNEVEYIMFYSSKGFNLLLTERVFPSRLALYVYEYLLHVGAQKAAQTFLSEVCCYN